jgi:hypothetical protein
VNREAIHLGVSEKGQVDGREDAIRGEPAECLAEGDALGVRVEHSLEKLADAFGVVVNAVVVRVPVVAH